MSENMMVILCKGMFVAGNNHGVIVFEINGKPYSFNMGDGKESDHINHIRHGVDRVMARIIKVKHKDGKMITIAYPPCLSGNRPIGYELRVHENYAGEMKLEDFKKLAKSNTKWYRKTDHYTEFVPNREYYILNSFNKNKYSVRYNNSFWAAETKKVIYVQLSGEIDHDKRHFYVVYIDSNSDFKSTISIGHIKSSRRRIVDESDLFIKTKPEGKPEGKHNGQLLNSKWPSVQEVQKKEKKEKKEEVQKEEINVFNWDIHHPTLSQILSKGKNKNFLFAIENWTAMSKDEKLTRVKIIIQNVFDNDREKYIKEIGNLNGFGPSSVKEFEKHYKLLKEKGVSEQVFKSMDKMQLILYVLNKE